MGDAESVFGPVISRYTRTQALEDGQLVDLTPWAKVYFKIPVAVTAAVWGELERACRELEHRQGRALKPAHAPAGKRQPDHVAGS